MFKDVLANNFSLSPTAQHSFIFSSMQQQAVTEMSRATLLCWKWKEHCRVNKNVSQLFKKFQEIVIRLLA